MSIFGVHPKTLLEEFVKSDSFLMESLRENWAREIVRCLLHFSVYNSELDEYYLRVFDERPFPEQTRLFIEQNSLKFNKIYREFGNLEKGTNYKEIANFYPCLDFDYNSKFCWSKDYDSKTRNLANRPLVYFAIFVRNTFLYHHIKSAVGVQALKNEIVTFDNLFSVLPAANNLNGNFMNNNVFSEKFINSSPKFFKNIRVDFTTERPKDFFERIVSGWFQERDLEFPGEIYWEAILEHALGIPYREVNGLPNLTEKIKEQIKFWNETVFPTWEDFLKAVLDKKRFEIEVTRDNFKEVLKGNRLVWKKIERTENERIFLNLNFFNFFAWKDLLHIGVITINGKTFESFWDEYLKPEIISHRKKWMEKSDRYVANYLVDKMPSFQESLEEYGEKLFSENEK